MTSNDLCAEKLIANDNASMESFHLSLKKELIYLSTIDDKKTTQLKVFDYIEGFYNENRIHSSLGFISPEKFESNYQKKRAL